MTPLTYTKGLKSIEYKFRFENGHRASVYKEMPHDLFIVNTDVEFIHGTNLTNIGVAMLLDDLACLGDKKNAD